ncbi:MAG: DUF2779 domain-containing protein [Gammaproteobacteria bacterium]
MWLHTFRPELAEEDADAAARFATGSEVGEIARSLHTDGLLIEGETLTRALTLTRQALKATPKRVLFEATFEHDKVLVRPDLLLPARKGYRMVEVKSTTTVKEPHYEDAAVQAWVTREAGMTLAAVEIAHIDNSFVYPGGNNYEGLFTHVDVTKETRALAREIPAWVKGARRTLAGKEPGIDIGDQCHAPYDCPFFGYCNPDSADTEGYPPEILPYGKTVAKELRAEGYTDLREVPKGRLTKANHVHIWKASVTGKATLHPQAGKLLKKYPYPRYYFDFETINPAVPIWAGTRPYQQVPFQWSCHREDRNGKLQASAFLAPDADDPRRACAESLLKAVGNSGPIFAYNASFESGRLKELGSAFPDLKASLDAVRERIVDLLPSTRAHYYHPDMRGSFSIKFVLPTVAPELNYENLDVADGAMAQEAFKEMIHPDTRAKRRKALRDALLEYCDQDTLALVRLARFFQGN